MRLELMCNSCSYITCMNVANLITGLVINIVAIPANCIMTCVTDLGRH